MKSGYDQERNVKVNFYGTLRPVVGGKTIRVDLPEGCSIDQVLAELITRYPALQAMLFQADGALQPAVHIFVNGRDAHWLPDSLGTRLDPSDSLDIFPPVGGG
jgi:MoaD family protein